jgi:hypothetical protein
MRILITGAASNTGRGLIERLAGAGHKLVLTELNVLPNEKLFRGHKFVQCDIQAGVGLERAAVGCDVVVHLPAWHGVHLPIKTDVDYWRLNIDGTFWAFEAMRGAGVKKMIYLSSQAWHGHYERYGFTKRIGEELCEYNRVNYGISYVAVRPMAFLPWENYVRFGQGLLYGGVDREDVLDSIVKSIEWLAQPHKTPRGGHVNSTRNDPYDEAALKNWSNDPYAAIESIFPGCRPLLDKYEIDIKAKPMVQKSALDGLAKKIGYRPSRHFGTFLKDLKKLDAKFGKEGVLAQKCPFGTRNW